VNPPEGLSSDRDPGITDEVWFQLQRDKQAAETARHVSQEEIRSEEHNLRAAMKREKEANAEAEKLATETAAATPPLVRSALGWFFQDAAAAQEQENRRLVVEQKKQEAIRAQQLAAQERDRIALILKQRKEEKAKQEQREKKVQVTLHRMGKCPVGYQWIKQTSGYRCAGGSHVVSDQDLNRMLGT